jgi:hypothetical protein
VRGQNVSVQVDTSLAGILLHGRIDRIVITGHDVTEPNATLASVAVTLSDVSLLDRTFAAASGTLSGVDIGVGSATPIHVDSVDLSGSTSTLTATVQISAAVAAAAITARLRAAGVPIDGVSLASGRIDLTIDGQLVETQAVLAANSLSLQVGSAFPSLPILTGASGGAWRIDAVDVSPAGLRLVVSVPVG